MCISFKVGNGSSAEGCGLGRQTISHSFADATGSKEEGTQPTPLAGRGLVWARRRDVEVSGKISPRHLTF